MKRLSITLALALLGAGSAQNTGPQFVNNMVRAGELITNTGTLEGEQGDGGEAFTSSSNTVKATVAQIGGVKIMSGPDDTSSAAAPGQTISVRRNTTSQVAYTVTNTGNGLDDIALTFTTTHGGGMTLWADLNGNGTQDSGEERLSGQSVNLPAGTVITVYSNETIGNVASGTRYVEQLSGTSNVDGASDTENYAALVVQSDLGATLESDSVSNILPGQTLTLTKTLTNTGNTTLSGMNVQFTATDTDAQALMSYTYQLPGGAVSPSLQGAWDSYVGTGGSLSMGSSVDITVKATARATGVAHLTQAQRINEVTLVATSGDNVPATPEQDSMDFTARVFASTHVKEQALCSLNGGSYNCAPLTQADLQPKPCDVMIYKLTTLGLNDLGQVRRPIITDDVSGLLNVLWARAYGADSEANYASSPLVMPTQIDGNGWVSGENVPGGPTIFFTTVEAGYDANRDGTLTSSDAMIGKSVLKLMVATQVAGNTCAAFTPGNTSNLPQFP